MEIDHIGLAPSGMIDSGNTTPVTKGGKNAQQGQGGGESQVEDEETKLIRALKELDTLHSKLIDLRSTIPKMIQPVHNAAAYSGPEELFQDFMKRTVKASEDIVDFTNMMVENKWIFEQATASRAADPKDIKRWKFSASQPAYLTADEKAKANASSNGNGINANSSNGAGDGAASRRTSEIVREDVDMADVSGAEENSSVVLEEFRKSHDEKEITITEKDGEIKVSLPKPVNLNFTIKKSTSNEKQRWLVSMPQPSNLHVSIFRSITTRPNPQSLKHLLEMILAYTTVYSQKCEKCDNLTGVPNAALPVIRRLIKTIRIERTEKKKDPSSEKKKNGSAKSESAKEGSGTAKNKEDDDKKKKEINDKKVKQEGKDSSTPDMKLDDSQELMDIKKEEAPGGDDDFDENEVLEEKWVAYHETCIQ